MASKKTADELRNQLRERQQKELARIRKFEKAENEKHGKAFIKLAKEHSMTAEQLMEYCIEQLSKRSPQAKPAVDEVKQSND